MGVDITSSGGSGATGALVGISAGMVRSVYATGSINSIGTGSANTGGLVGYFAVGAIAASWSGVDVSEGRVSAYAGGLRAT